MATFDRTGSRRSALFGHALFWTVFVVVLWLYYGLAHDKASTGCLHTAGRILLKTALLSAFFYFHAGVLIPRLLAPRRITAYGAALLGCFALYVGHDLVALRWYPQKQALDWFSLQPYVLDDVLAFLLILVISGGFTLTKYWFQSEAARETAQMEQALAELAILKTQVNPHFLFNTLNNLRALARREEAGQTEDALVRLAHLMRYMLHDARQDRVALAQEVAYLEDYVALQKLRLPPEMDVTFETEGSLHGVQIASLLLVPFVENAFKHGVSFRDKGRICLRLTVEPEPRPNGARDEHAAPGLRLHFEVVNTKGHTKAASKEIPSGFGLHAVRRRLALLYPERHDLVIQEDEAAFTARLTLDLRPAGTVSAPAATRDAPTYPAPSFRATVESTRQP